MRNLGFLCTVSRQRTAASASATLLMALVLWGSGGTRAAPAVTVLKLAPDQLTAYRGTAVLVQSIGEDTSTFDFKAQALYLASPGEGDSLNLLTARYLKAVDESETFGSVDRYLVDSGGTTLTLEARGEVAYELAQHMHMLTVYLPWETLPTFALPEVGQSSEAKEKVSVLNLATVEALLRTSTTRQGESLEVTRELSTGERPSFEFRGNAAKVVLFRQKYTIAPESGRVKTLESDCAFEFSQDDTTIRLERKVRLEETSSTGVNGPDAPAWARLIKEVPSIEEEFEARKPSEEIAKRLAGFVRNAAGTPLAAISGALEFRLEAFQNFFEATPSGRVLAGVLGRKAPDFTLKDLDGKDFAFRAAVARNKVTLLSFWGYG